MRTTLTLDDDVAAVLRKVLKEKNMTLREVVNDALRLGLADLNKSTHVKPFRTRTESLGGSLVGDLDNVAEVLAVAEGETYR